MHESESGGIFCHVSKLPTLSCNHRHGVEVFGRRLGSIPLPGL